MSEPVRQKLAPPEGQLVLLRSRCGRRSGEAREAMLASGKERGRSLVTSGGGRPGEEEAEPE